MKPFLSRQFIFTAIYHNVSNQSKAQNNDAENYRGGSNVIRNLRLIIARVWVRREISMNATIVQRRQQFYVLVGTRKVHISYMAEKEFGCVYQIGELAVVEVADVGLGSRCRWSAALPPPRIKNKWTKFIIDV